MAKEWCVEGLELKFTIDGSDITSTGTAVINSTPSDKTKVNGNGVYYDQFKVTFSGSSYNGYTQVSPADFTIDCSAEYSKEDDKPIMVAEDNGTVDGVSFQQGQSATTYSIKCEVKDPGQDVVKEM